MKLESSQDELLVPKVIADAVYPSLKGKGVLITGGGSGIGMYLVEAFCAQGAKVSFLDINEDAAARVAEVCDRTTGNKPVFEHADVRDISSMQEAIAKLRAQIGPITALVNNAGNDDRVPFDELTPAYWDERQHTNLRHHIFAAQAVLPDMQNQGGGSIVSMGSNSWMQGAPGLLAYTTAKSALLGFVRCLSREVGRQNIRVNAVTPGWILTDRQVTRARNILTQKFDEYLEKQALKEFLLPPDIARMALFLCADDSRMITGQSMIVDGGVV